jgi:hypothetical protein
MSKFLPNLWGDKSVIINKADKHDDTAVHTGMQIQQITLLYPLWSTEQDLWMLFFFINANTARLAYSIHAEGQ